MNKFDLEERLIEFSTFVKSIKTAQKNMVVVKIRHSPIHLKSLIGVPCS